MALTSELRIPTEPPLAMAGLILRPEPRLQLPSRSTSSSSSNMGRPSKRPAGVGARWRGPGECAWEHRWISYSEQVVKQWDP
eukprot:scaffold136198_cov15-Tisochrysis_lutea.AAC.1